MKRIVATVLVAVWALGAASVFAGEGCPAHAAKAEKKTSCSDVLAKFNLTEEQKTKITALKAECDATKCTETSRAKFMGGAKEILTAEQYKEFEAQCKAACAAKAEKKY